MGTMNTPSIVGHTPREEGAWIDEDLSGVFRLARKIRVLRAAAFSVAGLLAVNAAVLTLLLAYCRAP